jgi:hypothetical protein
MNIYESEINDGLSEKLGSNSIAFECQIIDGKDLIGGIPEDVMSALAFTNIVDRPIQGDLYYLNSILVSAGWNKNDDVFDVEDLFNAKSTPVDKPFNYMHDDSDIIGHMIASAAISEDGQIIDSLPLPERLDIVTSAVIYKVWSDPDQKARVQGLIDQIDRGELAVSMECVFRNFDYALISPNGEKKVLARNESTAFLTKHLRVYGGAGEFEGYKIGRLLRDLYFSGKGLVDKPANPRSLILPKDVNPFGPIQANMILTAMEKPMPDETLAELEIAKANVSNLTKEVDSYKESIAKLESKVAELEQSIATITEEKMTLSQELQVMVANMKTAARKTALLSAGADETKAEDLVTKFAAATDEMFETVVALVFAPVPVVAETDPVEVETEEDADVEELEDVEEVEATVVDLDETTSDKISIASAWLRNNVLKTTKNKGS